MSVFVPAQHRFQVFSYWRRGIWATCLFFGIAISLAEIAGTYRVFNQTFDEPAHIAAGIELLDRGTYSFEQQHPPLARAAAAIAPYLLGARLPKGTELGDENYTRLYDLGNEVLYHSPAPYEKILTAARVGVLPFFFILLWATWVWSFREFGAVSAAASTLLLASTPAVLAHAALATNDIALTAFTTASVVAFVRWLEQPDSWRTAVVAALVSLAVTSKLSALVFLPACFGTVLALRLYGAGKDNRTLLPLLRGALRGLPVALPIGGLIIWIVYGCPADLLQPISQLRLAVREGAQHYASGHISFFWGEVGFHGWWLFFPVTLLIKTPLPLFILATYGSFVVVRGAWTK
jgi:dolichyl-phosphate-mannose-protein mannosyltransferase